MALVCSLEFWCLCSARTLFPVIHVVSSVLWIVREKDFARKPICSSSKTGPSSATADDRLPLDLSLFLRGVTFPSRILLHDRKLCLTKTPFQKQQIPRPKLPKKNHGFLPSGDFPKQGLAPDSAHGCRYLR